MSKKFSFRFFSLLPFFAAIVLTASASENSDVSGEFYGQADGSGYYWYEIAKKEETETSEIHEYGYDRLWGMHPDEFREHQDGVTKLAVQSPTAENVERYLMVQDVARRKSAAFAAVVSMVGQQKPEYGTGDVYPTTAPGRKAVTKLREREYDETILNARNEFALIMFTNRECGFCEAQMSILHFFDNKYKWPIRMVDIADNPEFAARFGVEITPTILLVKRDGGEHLLVSSGVVSMENLKRRLFRSVRYMRGEITPEQWALFEFERNSGHDPTKFVKEN